MRCAAFVLLIVLSACSKQAEKVSEPAQAANPQVALAAPPPVRLEQQAAKTPTIAKPSPAPSAPAIQPQPRATTAPGLSDGDVKLALMGRSAASYSGNCRCPEDTDRAGRRCGKRSAYLRAGGAAPLCYDSDVTPAMILQYRQSLAPTALNR